MRPGAPFLKGTARKPISKQFEAQASTQGRLEESRALAKRWFEGSRAAPTQGSQPPPSPIQYLQQVQHHPP